MMTNTQFDISIPKMASYQTDWLAHSEEGKRLDRFFRDIITDLVEWEAEASDEGTYWARYKAAGYPATPRARNDIRRAFAAAIGMQNGNNSAGRKQALGRVAQGEAGYGRRMADDIQETNDLVNEGKKKMAKWNLFQKIMKRIWWPLGQIVRVNYEILNWDDVLENLNKFIEAWHQKYDAEIAANKEQDAKRAAK